MRAVGRICGIGLATLKRSLASLGDRLQHRESCHVAIIWAGPYGLAAAAHLRANDVETRIFGAPMECWQRHMPRGMFLGSGPSASSRAAPSDCFALDRC